MGGGDMIRTVTLESFTPNELPWKFEAGTPAIAEAIGLGAAVDYLIRHWHGEHPRPERELTAYALDRLTPTARRDGLRPRPPSRKAAW